MTEETDCYLSDEAETSLICPHGCKNGEPYASKQKLQVHYDAVHNGLKPHVCKRAQDGKICGQSFTQKAHLIRHIAEIHDKLKPHVCDRVENDKICGKSFTQKGNLTKHIADVHDKLKLHVCATCGRSFAQKGNLIKHVNEIHLKLRPHECTTCDYKAARKVHLQRHDKSMHTPEGQRRQKIKESRVFVALNKAGVQFTNKQREFRIEFSCFTTSGKFARIDGAKDGSPYVLPLLEVDEDQHRDYMQSCEQRRMMDVISAIRATGDLRKILWIRFNPDAYTVDDEKQKTLLKDRIAKLADVINNYTPEKDCEIVYMYYDAFKDAQGGLQAVVTTDSDFNADLCACVSRVIV